eukprot:gene11211-11361_t
MNAALGYQELFHRIVPVELSSFSTTSPLSTFLGSSQLPLELKDFYSNFYYREVLPTAAASGNSGANSPRISKAALCAAGGTCRSAGVEMMRVRVLAHSVSGVTTSVRLEMTCDSCLFFHYAANISAASFHDIKEDCGLIIEFAQLPALLLRLLNLLVDHPATYQASLLLRSDGAAELEFAQHLEFKTLSLMSMQVEAVPQALVRQRCPNLLQLQVTSSSSVKAPGSPGRGSTGCNNYIGSQKVLC